jgi:hypothetical protein
MKASKIGKVRPAGLILRRATCKWPVFGIYALPRRIRTDLSRWPLKARSGFPAVELWPHVLGNAIFKQELVLTIGGRRYLSKSGNCSASAK